MWESFQLVVVREDGHGGAVVAVLMLARRELVRRWRSALAITMLVGLVGAVVLASAAGAHRSSTSLRRFIAESRSSDVELDLDHPSPAELTVFRRVPQVADFAVLHVYALLPHGLPSLKNAASVDGRIGSVVDRARLVRGRVANPDAADEIMIGEGLAAEQHLDVGGHLDAESMTPAQTAMTFAGKDPGPGAGPAIRLRIVGIYRRPLDLGDLAASGGVVIETQAFDRAYAPRIGLFTTVLRVRTRAGAADVPAVTAAAHRVFGQQFSTATDVSAESHGAEDAINVLTLALWIFAGIAALAGGVAISMVLARDASESKADQATLSALGFTPRQRVLTLELRVLLVLAGGLLVACVVAIALSPLFPIGIARKAEPTPGLSVDGLILGVGLGAIAAFVVLAGLVASMRAARPPSPPESRAHRSRRTVVEVITSSGVRPSVSNGLRMALEPGRGPTGVPVRSAYLGAVFGVVGLTAVLVLSSSLGHLDASPRLYGWTWDFKAADNTFTSDCGTSDYGLHAVPGVAAVDAVCYQTGLPIDGRPTSAWAFTAVQGSLAPEIARGRVPETPSEVALGATTLHALGKRIGDTVRAGNENATREFRIVGQVVLPQLEDGELQSLGDGAAFTGAGFAPLLERDNHTRYLVGTFAPGVDRTAVGRRIDGIAAFGAPAQERDVVEHGIAGPSRPPEVARISSVRWFAPVLALLIAVLALVAVGHAIVTTVYRRRSEVAVLKTLGFERRQVRAMLAWQATALAAIGLVIGIPVGLFVGEAVWNRVAESLGIAPVIVLPALALVASVPVAIALFNAVAFWPARSAARTRPTRALAVE
jgi:ABC-type antimicrobial peptide transport system permease subunit